MLYFSIAVLFAGNKSTTYTTTELRFVCHVLFRLFFIVNLRYFRWIVHKVHYGDVSCISRRLKSPTLSRRSLNTSKLRFTGLCEGNPPMTGGSPHKGPFAFHYVIRSSFAHFCCGLLRILPISLMITLPGWRLSHYQWCNPERYGKSKSRESNKIQWYNHNKTNKRRIFYYKYCI